MYCRQNFKSTASAWLAAVLLVLITLAGSRPVCAVVEPVCWFGNNMVLQRDAPVPVWGWATPGETVAVSFQRQQVAAKADTRGCWKAVLKPLKAGGPAEDLIIAGSSRVVLTNVLVGDVWICGGQSNMVHAGTEANLAKPPAEWGWTEKSELAHFPAEGEVVDAVRLFHVGWNSSQVPVGDIRRAATWGPFERTNLNKDVCPEEWRPATRDALRYFSRLAFFFGHGLQTELKIPIGLICVAQGSTSVLQWTSAETLARVRRQPALAAATAQPRYKEKDGGLESGLFNGMIAPLTGFACKGFIWWQGENDRVGEEPYGSAQAYVDGAFTEMIRDYRARWGRDDLPFLFVQLQNFNDGVESPAPRPQAVKATIIRDCQRQALALPRTGMAVILDLAAGLHPQSKWDVAQRLLPIARAIAYGQDVPYSGPLYRSARVEGNAIRLQFDHIGKGLVLGKGIVPRGFKGVLYEPNDRALSRAQDTNAAFEISAGDGVWVKADARIDGAEVVVSAPGVEHPKFAAYGMNHVNPAQTVIKTTLFNAEGFPASPFDTSVKPAVTR